MHKVLSSWPSPLHWPSDTPFCTMDTTGREQFSFPFLVPAFSLSTTDWSLTTFYLALDKPHIHCLTTGPLNRSIQPKLTGKGKVCIGTTLSAGVYTTWNAFCSDSKVFLQLGLRFYQYGNQAQRHERKPNSPSHSHSHWLLSKSSSEHIILLFAGGKVF